MQVAPAWGADVEVVIAGLTNTYSSYITTWEEYQARAPYPEPVPAPTVDLTLCQSCDADHHIEICCCAPRGPMRGTTSARVP